MNGSVGQRLGKYEIHAELGRGGMGIVYRGYDAALRRPVAIKILPPQLAFDADFVRRFQQEAILAASLRHPHIVTIHDVGEQAGVYYIVMEFLEGMTLEHWLDRHGPLTPALAAQIVRQVADALDYAHAHGVIHRDVKPANIMVGADGRATLMDFGLVRAAEGTHLTRSGTIMGTPEYMSPEQALGQPLDGRSDVYSLGVVLYRMLAGKPPFSGTSPLGITHAHVYDPPPPLRQARPDLPASLEAVIARALAKRPEERFARAGLLAEAFTAAVEGGDKTATVSGVRPPELAPPQTAEPTRQMMPRTRPSRTTERPLPRGMPWLAAGLGFLAVIGAGFGLFFATLDRNTRSPAAGAPLIAAPTALIAREVRVAPTDAPRASPVVLSSTIASTRETPVASATQTKPTAAFSPTPSVTASPTPIPPAAIPVVRSVSGSVNARSGPGTAYPAIGQTRAGETYQIIGRNADTSWWQICCVDGRPAWVAAEVVEASGPLGQVAVVAVPTSPPPVAASGPKFVQLSLTAFATANLKDGYANPPLGQITLGSVPFDLKSGETVTTQAAPLPNNPTRLWLPASTANVRTVYLLLTGGDLYLDYDRRPFGKVRLLFADKRDYAVDLVGGVNVREWKHGSGVVSSISSPDVSEVWRSSDRHDGSPAIIDLLRIAVPADLQVSRLEGIEVLDTSATTVGNLDPAINVLGVTLAVETPPAPPTATLLPACSNQPGPTFARAWDRSRLGCPRGPEATVWSAYETFERGWMFWRKDDDGHYVFFSDGAYAGYWYPAGEPPDFACSQAQAMGRPRRGFSRVWCENPSVRQRIGNAVDDEIGDNRPVQKFDNGFMVYVRERRAIITAVKDNTWNEQR